MPLDSEDFQTVREYVRELLEDLGVIGEDGWREWSKKAIDIFSKFDGYCEDTEDKFGEVGKRVGKLETTVALVGLKIHFIWGGVCLIIALLPHLIPLLKKAIK